MSKAMDLSILETAHLQNSRKLMRTGIDKTIVSKGQNKFTSSRGSTHP